MPKQKKPPKTAIYFYALERKAELGDEGYVFRGGIKDVIDAVYGDWKVLTPEAKAKYDQMAKDNKEKEKYNLHNKFTSTGESYALVMERQEAMKKEEEYKASIVDELVSDYNWDKQIFVCIKTIHSCDVRESDREMKYFPLEIALVAFNLRDGYKADYWTLVDTQDVPMGYSSVAKDTSEWSALPIPGSSFFKEFHRDYNSIFKNIRGFISHAQRTYKKDMVLFAFNEDIISAQHCLKWIAQKVDKDTKKYDNEQFVDKIRFFDFPRFVIKLAKKAGSINPNYKHPMVLYGIDKSAEDLLSMGTYDFHESITCKYHNMDKNSHKASQCCLNMVLRRTYLLYAELLPALNFERMRGHDIRELFAIKKEAADKKLKDRQAAASAQRSHRPPSPEKTKNLEDGELNESQEEESAAKRFCGFLL